MTTPSQDPKGYYAVLGLTPGADLTAIKAAYRSRAKAVHPDRNSSARARDEFQRLVEAYRVLRDVVNRAEYDATGGHPLIEDGDDYPATPFACSICGKITAQPRHIIFHRIRSYVVWARRSRVEGIFCRDCADRAAVQASTATWAWGFWSPPGLLLAPLALIRNLFGGTKPRDQNARLLIRQARAFLALDDVEIARALADQAAQFARISVQKRQIEDVRRATTDSARRMKDRWAPWGSGVFVAQALPLAALPVVVVLFVLIGTKPWDRPVASKPAGIVFEPASIGDIRHVAVDDLKLRQAAGEAAPVLTLLDRFTTVQVIDKSAGGEWTEIRIPAGITGWVPRRALYAGPGALDKQEWCGANKGSAPQAGEILVRRATGEHRLLIHNDGRTDAVVKLKTASGTTVVSYFVPATYHIGVGGIPEGTYRIEFATGRAYSRACGLFTEGMQAGVLPFTVTFKSLTAARMRSTALPEIALVAPPGDAKAPQPLDIERFTRDD